ncbi:hypothetical protein GMDG_08885, partial [Pseudogymnoascus destructans 20631-21]
MACGVGYGAKLLAEAGHRVVAVDRSDEAIDYACEHYAHERVQYVCAEAGAEAIGGANFDAVVCLETLEHLEDPQPLLQEFCRAAPILIASVPNEDQFPHRGMIAFHHRHYRPHEFKALIEGAGFVIRSWYGQEGGESELEPDLMGRTIMVIAERGEPDAVVAAPVVPSHRKPDGPKRVVLVGL